MRTSIVLFVLVMLAGCKGDYPKVFGLDWKENATTSPSGERDQRSYEFTEDSVIARRTCGTTVVSVSSPAIHGAYLGYTDFTARGGGCSISLGGTDDDPYSYLVLTIDGEDLITNIIGDDDEYRRFSPDGTTRGIYGEWVSPRDDGDWSYDIERDEMTVSTICGSGKGTGAIVPIDVEHFIDIATSVEDTSVPGCEIGLVAGESTYLIEGNQITWQMGGETILLTGFEF